MERLGGDRGGPCHDPHSTGSNDRVCDFRTSCALRPVPVIDHVANVLAVTYTAHATVAESVPSALAFTCERAFPVTEHVAPTPAVTYDLEVCLWIHFVDNAVALSCLVRCGSSVFNGDYITPPKEEPCGEGWVLPGDRQSRLRLRSHLRLAKKKVRGLLSA